MPAAAPTHIEVIDGNGDVVAWVADIGTLTPARWLARTFETPAQARLAARSRPLARYRTRIAVAA